MATENWINVDPTSGVGSADVTVTIDEHTGREKRTGFIKSSTEKGATDTVTVTQDGIDVFTEITDWFIDIVGGVLTINGRSNADSLEVSSDTWNSFTLQAGGLDQTDWDGVENASVYGDPGKFVAYDFSLFTKLDTDWTDGSLQKGNVIVNGSTFEIESNHAEMDSKSIDAASEGGEYTLFISTNADTVTARVTEKWITVSKGGNGECVVTVEPNTENTARTGYVQIVCAFTNSGSITLSCTVTQAAAE